MDPLAQVLPDLLRALMRNPHLSTAVVRRLWPRLIRPPLDQIARPVALEEGRLVVEVVEEWRRELEPFGSVLVARLNEVLGPVLREVVWITPRPS
jgi:hypothetical protein